MSDATTALARAPHVPSPRHCTRMLGLNEFQGNQNRGNGNWSVGNVSSLSMRKASAVGERWAAGASAQPTVHRPVLWTAQLSTVGACDSTVPVAQAARPEQIHSAVG